MSRTAWQLEADRRWPDGWDMVQPIFGDGPWATVAWCGHGLSVHLHPDLEAAAVALGTINRAGCGGDCWGEHELVNLAEPEAIDPEAEYRRGPRRAAHAAVCGVCRHVYRDKAAGAAMRRANARRRRAVA